MGFKNTDLLSKGDAWASLLKEEVDRAKRRVRAVVEVERESGGGGGRALDMACNPKKRKRKGDKERVTIFITDCFINRKPLINSHFRKGRFLNPKSYQLTHQ
jgi:hypothetical protein